MTFSVVVFNMPLSMAPRVKSGIKAPVKQADILPSENLRNKGAARAKHMRADV